MDVKRVPQEGKLSQYYHSRREGDYPSDTFVPENELKVQYQVVNIPGLVNAVGKFHRSQPTLLL